MIYCRFMVLFALVVLALPPFVPAAHAEQSWQSAQLRAGAYFPASKSFDVGSGIDLAYSVKPFPFASFDAGIGYYRAESGTSGFLSALPLTVSATAILPLDIINIHAGGGVGTYFKMAGGTTELPADHSELSLGYHVNAGFEFPAYDGVSLLVEGKYVFVNQGKFKSYDIKHDGAFVYGGFALNF